MSAATVDSWPLRNSLDQSVVHTLRPASGCFQPDAGSGILVVPGSPRPPQIQGLRRGTSMKRKRPMLVITLQIPLTEDLSAEDVLEALREQTEAALQMVRERMLQEDGEDDSDYEESEVPAPTVALA